MNVVRPVCAWCGHKDEGPDIDTWTKDDEGRDVCDYCASDYLSECDTVVEENDGPDENSAPSGAKSA